MSDNWFISKNSRSFFSYRVMQSGLSLISPRYSMSLGISWRVWRCISSFSEFSLVIEENSMILRIFFIISSLSLRNSHHIRRVGVSSRNVMRSSDKGDFSSTLYSRKSESIILFLCILADGDISIILSMVSSKYSIRNSRSSLHIRMIDHSRL